MPTPSLGGSQTTVLTGILRHFLQANRAQADNRFNYLTDHRLAATHTQKLLASEITAGSEPICRVFAHYLAQEEPMTNKVFAVLMVVIGLGLFEAQTSAADAAPSGAAALATVHVRPVPPSRISESARREVLALVQRNDLGRDMSMWGVRFAQGGTSRKRHSIYFPIKVGAGVGCGSGATLAYFISPYMGDPGPNPGAGKAMVESCVVGGLIGAGIGCLIAAH